MIAFATMVKGVVAFSCGDSCFFPPTSIVLTIVRSFALGSNVVATKPQNQQVLTVNLKWKRLKRHPTLEFFTNQISDFVFLKDHSINKCTLRFLPNEVLCCASTNSELRAFPNRRLWPPSLLIEEATHQISASNKRRANAHPKRFPYGFF